MVRLAVDSELFSVDDAPVVQTMLPEYFDGKNRQRILLVETSGLPEFARARGFYSKSGYDETAGVRDYYAQGDDMVLFYKALSVSIPST